MAMRFALAFRKRMSGGGIVVPDYPVDDGGWGSFNPNPGGAFPEVEKEKLSIYLTSDLLGPDTIELKCMASPEDTDGYPYWESDNIPWKGDGQLLDYCGLGGISPTEVENLTVKYSVQHFEIITGGEEISADKMTNYGETPGGYKEIDNTSLTYDNIWIINATYFLNNSDGELHLVLGYLEMVPEGGPCPGNDVLFGTYRLIQYYWEGWDPVDLDNPSGDWQPGGGYYPGITETATSYVVSPYDPNQVLPTN